MSEIKKRGFLSWWPAFIGIVSFGIFITVPMCGDLSWLVMAYECYVFPVVVVINCFSVIYAITRYIVTYQRNAEWNTPWFYVISLSCFVLLYVFYRHDFIFMIMASFPVAVICSLLCNYRIRSRYMSVIASMILSVFATVIFILVVMLFYRFLLNQWPKFGRNHALLIMLRQILPFSFPYCFIINNVFSPWKRSDAEMSMSDDEILNMMM